MPRFSDCWCCGNTVGVGSVCQLCGVAKYCSEKCQKNDIFRHEAECIPASILKTCTACRKSGPKLKACTGCYRAYYCDANCQKSNWERHKIDCIEVKGKIESLTQRILMHYFPAAFFPSVHPVCPANCDYYYWGNVPAFDCLNLVESEGGEYSLPLNVLFLGVGDLRNVALTCASLPDTYENTISFTLNDQESCVLARLVLLLFMLIKGDSEVEKTVTELWYSISLSESTYKCLIKTLKELIDIPSSEDLKSTTAGLIGIYQKHLEELRDVWDKWLDLHVEGTEWIQKQRKEVLERGELRIDRPTYIDTVPTLHTNAAKKWMKDGIFRRTQMKMPAFAENPTLTGYYQDSRDAPYSYRIQPEVFPFCGWDYVQAKKLKNTSCLVTMFGDYIECILRSFKNKLSKHQLTFQIVLCNCTEIKQHLEANLVFDRILTSNLMDYIILPVLLNLCSDMLNHSNPCATIITETIKWSGEFCPPDMVQVSKAMKLAGADEKQPSKVLLGAPNCREYIENACDFYDYLRALFHAHQTRERMMNACRNPTTINVPIAKDLGSKFKLRLRNYLRNENKIVFFKLAVNRRKVNFTNGVERFLEWIPLHEITEP